MAYEGLFGIGDAGNLNNRDLVQESRDIQTHLQNVARFKEEQKRNEEKRAERRRENRENLYDQYYEGGEIHVNYQPYISNKIKDHHQWITENMDENGNIKDESLAEYRRREDKILQDVTFLKDRTTSYNATVNDMRTEGTNINLYKKAEDGTYLVDFNEALSVRDAQALLDQMGLACDRRDNALRAQSARESAQTQKTRSLFLTSIAHDQRTQLASIMTSASAILEQTDRLSKDEIRHYAELIQEETQQVARLTDNTLTLARLSGEQVQVPMQLESVEDMVAAVLQRLRKRKTMYLPTVKVASGLPLLNCNMVLVEQVLDNLIDNAIKHSGAPGSVELNVLQQQGGVVFQVSDRGVGMQGQHKLQGDESRGMGIGLQLCHAVAQVHAGCLSFSTPAIARQGVLAIFTLPLAEAQEQGA